MRASQLASAAASGLASGGPPERTKADSKPDTQLLPTSLVAIVGSAGGSSSLLKALESLHVLDIEQTAFVVQLHQPLGQWDQRLLHEIEAAVAPYNKAHRTKQLTVQEVPLMHTLIAPGVMYVCEPGFVIMTTQLGEIKRVRSETANSAGLNTLFSELSTVQSYALVVNLIGVVLSGMAGNDAKDGARELQDAGGTIIVQDPTSCQFADMPSAVLNEVPDAVTCRPHEIFGRIAEVAKVVPDTADQRLLYEICRTVLRTSGCDFRVYHSSMVSRRVAHCMHLSRSPSLQEYAKR